VRRKSTTIISGDPVKGSGPIMSSATSRRGFLAVAGLSTVAGVAAVACSSDTKTATTGSTTAGSTPNTSATAAPTTAAAGTSTTAPKNIDLDIATVAAGLEVLAVQTYGAALDAATANKLGAVPPAVAEFATTAKAQHQAALAKWNSVLKAGGKPEVTEPYAKLKPTVDAAFAKVTDVSGVAALALMLEQIASASYQKAIPSLTSKDAIELAGSLEIIDAQHVAILLFVSGQYPVPDTFAKTDKAAA
jgi:hypothetical protein